MPEAEIRRRGGVVRWRTKRLPNGEIVHIAIVRKPGKRGGHTVAGEPRKKKGG